MSRNTNLETASRKCFGGCGRDVVSSDKKRRARFCKECRSEQRRAGQQQRWERERARDHRLAPRECGWSGCTNGSDGGRATIPSYRHYCTPEHYHLARVGRVNARKGRELFCSVCGGSLGYQRPSRIKRSRQHFCANCLADRRKEHPPRPRVPYYGLACGHPVSKPGVARCRSCYLTLNGRGNYSTQATRRVLEVQAGFPSAGRKITNKDWAKQADVSPATIYNVLGRIKRGTIPKPPTEPEPHPNVGTALGYR